MEKSNADFRALIRASATTAAAASMDDDDGGDGGGGGGGEKKKKSTKRAESYKRFLEKKAAKEQTKGPKYRDRAKERRDGSNKDYDEMLGGGADAGMVVDENISIEQSKYLGGDLAHTHLVKGLDFALIGRLKEEGDSEVEAKLEKAYEEATKPGATAGAAGAAAAAPASAVATAPAATASAAGKKDEVRFVSTLGRSVYRLHLEQTATNPVIKPAEHFLGGRMSFEFDLSAIGGNELPTTTTQSKSEWQPADERVSGHVTSDVSKRMQRIFGSKDSKQKKKSSLPSTPTASASASAASVPSPAAASSSSSSAAAAAAAVSGSATPPPATGTARGTDNAMSGSDDDEPINPAIAAATAAAAAAGGNLMGAAGLTLSPPSASSASSANKDHKHSTPAAATAAVAATSNAKSKLSHLVPSLAEEEDDIFGGVGRDYDPTAPLAADAKPATVNALPPPPKNFLPIKKPAPNANGGANGAAASAATAAPKYFDSLPAESTSADTAAAATSSLSSVISAAVTGSSAAALAAATKSTAKSGKAGAAGAAGAGGPNAVAGSRTSNGPQTMKSLLDSDYTDCYPDGSAGYDDDEGDGDDNLDKMDKGKDKDRARPWDFNSEAEWETYNQNKEANPKAAFQFGQKMADGRQKGAKKAEKKMDDKQKLNSDWNQIQQIMKKRPGDTAAAGGGGGGGGNKPALPKSDRDTKRRKMGK